MEDTLTFGDWVKQQRKILGLTQDALARLVACSKETVKKIESNERRPSVQIAKLLASSLEIASEDQPSFLRLARPDLSPVSAREADLPAPRAPQLPAPLTPLIGRAQEVAAASAMLMRPDVRLVTLSGPGGTGKTRLALQIATELADAFADGVSMVSLAPISDPRLTLTAIAQALGIKEPRDQSLQPYLFHYLADKELLLLLDNFEQIIPAARDIALLLAAAPRLKALVTSRATLQISGEHSFIVPPLAVPPLNPPPPTAELIKYPSVALFLQRARAARADFGVTDEYAQTIAKICARLDGLPLAIELAAAWTKLLTPQSLLGRLTGSSTTRPLDLLSTGAQELPARQQTLRTTIDWSYKLLDQEQQALFRRLGGFVGGCTLDAAEIVCGERPLTGITTRWGSFKREVADDSRLSPRISEILDGLLALVNQSLIRQVDGTDGEPRFIMLETLREYALERLEASGELAHVRLLHAEYYLELGEIAEEEAMIGHQEQWLARLDAEHDNLRAVLTWCVSPFGNLQWGLRMAGAIWEFWLIRGYVSEGRTWLKTLLSHPQASAPTLARARALNGAGFLAWATNNLEQALPLLHESLELFRQNNNQFGAAWALNHLAQVALAQHDLEAAERYCAESLALFRQVDAPKNSAWVLINLGHVARERSDTQLARRLYTESQRLFQQVGDKRGLAWTIEHIGRISQMQGDTEQAGRLFKESLTLFHDMGDKTSNAWVLNQLGRLMMQCGDLPQAISYFVEALTLYREPLERWGGSWAIIGLAGVAAQLGQTQRAARLLGIVERLFPFFEARMDVGDRDYYHAILDKTRDSMPDNVFAAEWMAGQDLTIEQGISLALDAG